MFKLIFAVFLVVSEIMRNFAARKEHYALIFGILIKKIIKKNEKNISASQSSSREQAWFP